MPGRLIYEHLYYYTIDAASAQASMVVFPTLGSKPQRYIFSIRDRPTVYDSAHQGVNRGSCGLVQRTGAVDLAGPHLGPSGGQAPRLAKSSTALHSPAPPLWIPAFAGMTNGGPERQVEESWNAGTIEAA